MFSKEKEEVEFDNKENIMANHKSRKRCLQTVVPEFVTVAFAEDMELAMHHKQILSENNISAVIKSDKDSSAAFPGIAVMVPEDDIDEAHTIIDSHASHESFYDMDLYDGDGDDDDDDDDYDDLL